MFHDNTLNARMHNDNYEDDYDFCSPETEQKFVINWSPQEENKFFSNHRFASPRVLSKSVPRRNKSLMRYRISRSLNFDTIKNDNIFKSPNSSSDSSSFEGDKYLTRSAKIMRALNFNTSPGYNGKRKIKKSLNFDLSSSPKQFTNSGKSLRNTLSLSLSTPSPKLNKNLNFDATDPSDSVGGLLTISNESIDENQNQTPSHRSRQIKTSPNFHTPTMKIYGKSPEVIVFSPMLRTGLKEKIDNIVHIGGTPNLHSVKQSKRRLENISNVAVSTPRNLFHDFHDEENDRPQTPENMIRIIPESMSAIKKSHKKERLSRRGERCATQINLAEDRTDILMATEDAEPLEHLEESESVESMPITPKMPKKHSSPIYGVNAIKQSHKKNKSKKILATNISDEELSDTGSNLDYIENEEKDSGRCVPTSIRKSQAHKVNEERDCGRTSSSYKETVGCTDYAQICQKTEHNESREEDLTATPSASEEKTQSRPVTPEMNNNAQDFQAAVITPENRINFFQRILTESIKKSHKKVKDENKKKLYRLLSSDHTSEVMKIEDTDNCPETQNDSLDSECETEDTTRNATSQDVDRAITPENVNSSRLLLSQFSSVKKSHKKDKHSKIISGFIKRQEYFNTECNSSKSAQYKVMSDSYESSCQTNSENSKSISISDSQGNQSVEISDDSLDFCHRLSPSKRKQEPNGTGQNVISDGLGNLDLLSMEYDNPEDEFRIFTPIKKRKSVPMQNIVKCLSTHKVLSEENICEKPGNIDLSRCLTPVRKPESLEDSVISEKDVKSPIEYVASQTQNTEDHVLDINKPELDDANGRSTPKNMSTVELLPNVNSIKKSHKKDKRGNGFRRELVLEQDNLFLKQRSNENLGKNHKHACASFVPSNCSNDDDGNSHEESQSFEIVDYDNPQPSTSQGIINTEDLRSIHKDETNSINTTPPNCLKTKRYIRQLQTTSIKKSHKKERERKKLHLMADDHELSDNGSIFGEENRPESSAQFQSETQNNDNTSKTDILVSDESERKSIISGVTVHSDASLQHETVEYYESVNLSGYMSDDGSSFYSDERLENMSDSLNDEN